MDVNVLAIVQITGFLFLGFCLLVGAYVLLRWGVTGVRCVWSKRREIDSIVAEEFISTIGVKNASTFRHFPD